MEEMRLERTEMNLDWGGYGDYLLSQGKVVLNSIRVVSADEANAD
jgi:hypothetical protein